MASIRSRLAFITGASSGIGASCARSFAAEGTHLILAARRKARLDDLASELRKAHGIRVHTVELDVRDRLAVEASLKGLPEDFRDIDILVNNAGLSRGLDKFHEGRIDDWEEMIDTNIKGLLYVTKNILPGMLQRGRGHVINIGSIAGLDVYPKGNVYNATKFAVDAITKGMRMDVVDTPVRVSTVDPGLVDTEFSKVRFRGDAQRAANVYNDIDVCSPDDIAEAVIFCATRPAHVSVNQVVIMPTAQASSNIKHIGPLTL